MFKRNYYCLVAGLTEIMINGNSRELASREFKSELLEQLHSSDYKLAELIYLQSDNENLLNLLLKQNEQFNTLGNYLEEYLEDQIKEPTDILEYLKNFILDSKSDNSVKSDLIKTNELQSAYYNYVLGEKNKFLLQWFMFERNIKNILTIVNCKTFGYEIDKHLISINQDDNIYESLIKGSPNMDLLADEIPYIDKILQVAQSELSVSEKEKAIDNIKWEFLDEYTTFDYFTIEKIMSYILKLELVDRWVKLDNETGKDFFNKLIIDVAASYNFPEEFSLKGDIKAQKN